MHAKTDTSSLSCEGSIPAHGTAVPVFKADRGLSDAVWSNPSADLACLVLHNLSMAVRHLDDSSAGPGPGTLHVGEFVKHRHSTHVYSSYRGRQ